MKICGCYKFFPQSRSCRPILPPITIVVRHPPLPSAATPPRSRQPPLSSVSRRSSSIPSAAAPSSSVSRRWPFHRLLILMVGTLSYPEMSGRGYMLWFGCHRFNFLLLKMRNPLLCLALESLAPWLRGMNYLHQHKPRPILHNNLNTRNLLISEGDQVKIGEYWIQMLYERIHPNPEKPCLTDPFDNLDASYDTNKDIYDFGLIFY